MKHSYYFAAALLGLIITTGIVAATSLAADTTAGNFGRGSKFNSAFHQEIIQALENRDYQTWKNLMGDNKITQTITAGNFDQYAQMQELLQQGKFTEAKAIADQLGLNGFGRGMMSGSKENFDPSGQQAIIDAINSSDYQAWKTAVDDMPIASLITQDNFAQYVEMQQLVFQARDKMKQAAAIGQQLGLPGNRGEHLMPGMGWH